MNPTTAFLIHEVRRGKQEMKSKDGRCMMKTKVERWRIGEESNNPKRKLDPTTEFLIREGSR